MAESQLKRARGDRRARWRGSSEHRSRDPPDPRAGAIERVTRLDRVHVPATRFTDLLQHLNEVQPDVVHFSGHGDDAGIVLHDAKDKSRLLTNGELDGLLRLSPKALKLVVELVVAPAVQPIPAIRSTRGSGSVEFLMGAFRKRNGPAFKGCVTWTDPRLYTATCGTCTTLRVAPFHCNPAVRSASVTVSSEAASSEREERGELRVA